MTTEIERHSSAADKVTDRTPNFDEWLKAYREEPTIRGRISLLHDSIGIAPFTFYLQEADGHTDVSGWRFLAEDEARDLILSPETRGNISESRRKIARKAFDILVSEYFKDPRTKYAPIEQWIGKVCYRGSIDALVHFFRLDNEQHFVNLNHQVPDHKREVVENFLFTLVRYGWENLPNDGNRDNDRIESFLASYRMDFLDILCGLGKLDSLLNFRYATQEVVGEAELEKLTGLALAKELYFSEAIWHSVGSRRYRPETIEQAAYAGSQAGKVAILLREKLKLHDHMKAVAEAHHRCQQADRELAQLSGQR